MRGGDEGFTIVELAVALAVIGVLLGIALPTFFGTRAGAQDQAAKSATLAGVKTLASTDPPVAVEAVRKAEPGLAFEELPPPQPDLAVPKVLGRVYVRSDEDQVTVVSRSASGRCYWAKDQDAVVTYGANDCSDEPSFRSSW